jgi:hypothetical protein
MDTLQLLHLKEGDEIDLETRTKQIDLVLKKN